jgi:arylsulfatase A-like enzyme
MLLHKQYVTPFAPMNALEKLVNAEQYQVLLSRDNILDAILAASSTAVALDGPEATMNLDFARTLETLKGQLDSRRADGRPLFVYTQPQNLHVSVIHREGDAVPAGESYAGFNAPYASRVKRIDAAFGSFIEFLKARGLYEHSIVVLTADHGDSLGEDGRWGHAYTLFPEIVRIPLLVHLPDELRDKLGSDPQNLAFSTDITPSLYYLLGHRPIEKNELYGRPLFTETPAERQRDPGASYLLASSYAAVYGMLSQNGRQFYIADGVNYQNHLFELSGLGAESRSFSAHFQQEQERLIRDQITAIGRFYHMADLAGGGR